MHKREATAFLTKLQRIYPWEKGNLEIKELTRGNWAIFIPNSLFIPVPFLEAGLEVAARLKRPEEFPERQKA